MNRFVTLDAIARGRRLEFSRRPKQGHPAIRVVEGRVEVSPQELGVLERARIVLRLEIQARVGREDFEFHRHASRAERQVRKAAITAA